jgi:TonB-dependent SusC/RagA subfamily outer membrane receptor
MIKMTHALLLVFLSVPACSHRGSSPVAGEPVQSNPPGTVLTADDIRANPGQSLEQLLMARVPGLTAVHAPDGRTILTLRGTTTLLGDAEPLFVVNGIALAPNSSSNLNAIDLHDIETVQVIRDAAATAAYGVRGANGVIIIRTKQP